MSQEQPTHADDLERILRILADCTPLDGLSIEEIQAEYSKSEGDVWSFRTINALLCDLGSSRVAHVKIRVKGGRKVTKYFLKVQS